MTTILEEVAARVEGAETGHGGRTLWLSGVRADINDRKLRFERCDCDEYDPFYPEQIRTANRLLDAYEAVRAERIAKRVAELTGGDANRVFDTFVDLAINDEEEVHIDCFTGIICDESRLPVHAREAADKLRAAFEQAKREVDGG